VPPTTATFALTSTLDAYEARNAASGAVRWTLHDPNAPSLIGAGVVINHEEPGSFVALDLRTGAERWHLAMPCLSVEAAKACTFTGGYVQAWSAGGANIALALNYFSGT